MERKSRVGREDDDVSLPLLEINALLLPVGGVPAREECWVNITLGKLVPDNFGRRHELTTHRYLMPFLNEPGDECGSVWSAQHPRLLAESCLGDGLHMDELGSRSLGELLFCDRAFTRQAIA